MKKLTMDDITYLVNDDVADLIVMLSEERDDLQEALTERASKLAKSPLERVVMPKSSKERKNMATIKRRIEYIAKRITENEKKHGVLDHDRRELAALKWAFEELA